VIFEFVLAVEFVQVRAVFKLSFQVGLIKLGGSSRVAQVEVCTSRQGESEYHKVQKSDY
jgi:hypothetical protein